MSISGNIAGSAVKMVAESAKTITETAANVGGSLAKIAGLDPALIDAATQGCKGMVSGGISVAETGVQAGIGAIDKTVSAGRGR